MKALLLVTILGAFNPDGSTATVSTEYDTWNQCVKAKELVMSQVPMNSFNTAHKESDLIAYCVPIKDKAKEREAVITGFMKFLQSLPKTENPLTKQ